MSAKSVHHLSCWWGWCYSKFYSTGCFKTGRENKKREWNEYDENGAKKRWCLGHQRLSEDRSSFVKWVGCVSQKSVRRNWKTSLLLEDDIGSLVTGGVIPPANVGTSLLSGASVHVEARAAMAGRVIIAVKEKLLLNGLDSGRVANILGQLALDILWNSFPKNYYSLCQFCDLKWQF